MLGNGPEFEQRVMLSLGRIEAKVDNLVALRAEDQEEAKGRETRISSLEQWKAKVAAIAALVGAVVGGLASLAGKFLLDLLP